MSLETILSVTQDSTIKRQHVTKERVDDVLGDLRNQIAFFREYPDIFIDFLLSENNPKHFKFLHYQRIFLRATMRHRYVYATFPRGYSKSFLSMMALMVRCILYPNSHLFVTTGGKEPFEKLLRVIVK